MANKKTDKRGFSSSNPDVERDLGAKGGPATGTGNPAGSHGITSPYSEDTQTQAAAKSKAKKKTNKKG